MNKTILLVAGLLTLPMVTSAGFTDIYSTWVERLLGNPTSMYEQMQSFESYGQRASVDAQLSTPDGEGKLHVATDFQIDKHSNFKGNIALAASGQIEQQTGSIAGSADVILSSGTLYVKPIITELPELIPADEKVGFQLLDGKWIQVSNEATPIPVNTTPGGDSLAFAKEFSQLITTTPILKPTKALTRNGYEIYLVQVDETGVEHLVAGVMKTVMQQANLPYDASLATTPVADFKQLGVKTIGVIGKKGDEIKMGMIIKNNNEPVQVLFSTNSTSTTAEAKMQVTNKVANEIMFSLHVHTTTPTKNNRDMSITFGSSEEHIDGNINIQSEIYDAGVIEVTAPTGAILLQDLVQGR